MVVEILSKKNEGGLGFALDFVSRAFLADAAVNAAVASVVGSAGASTAPMTRGPRPWCIVETDPSCRLYLPGLPSIFREKAAQGLIRWIQSTEVLAPSLCQMLLESSLCEGVWVAGLENFVRSQPAALWGRRWQLAAHQGGSHFLWLHERRQAVIGFDVKLEWTGPKNFEIKKGHGYFSHGNLNTNLNTSLNKDLSTNLNNAGIKNVASTQPQAA